MEARIEVKLVVTARRQGAWSPKNKKPAEAGFLQQH
jgi:hypothetical protein